MYSGAAEQVFLGEALKFFLYISSQFFFPFSITLNFGETVASPVPTPLNVLPLCFCEYFEFLRKLEYMYAYFLGKTSQDILTMDDNIGGVEDPFGQK